MQKTKEVVELANSGLMGLLRGMEQFRELEHNLTKKQLHVYGLEEAQKHVTIALIGDCIDSPLVVVAGSEEEAKKTASDLTLFQPEETVCFFPAREILPVNSRAQTREVVSQRVETLKKVLGGGIKFLVTTYEGLARRLSPPELFSELIAVIETGDSLGRNTLITKLASTGYERVDVVEIPGQFAVRGGLVDIFPIAVGAPARVEFFGDEVDTIHYFDTKTQLSREKTAAVVVPPAVEFCLPGDNPMLQNGCEAVVEAWQAAREYLTRNRQKSAVVSIDYRINSLLEEIKAGKAADDLEPFLPLFVPEIYTVLDYFRSAPVLIVDEPLRLSKAAIGREKELKRSFHNLVREGEALEAQAEMLLTYDQLEREWNKYQGIHFSLLPRSDTEACAINVPGRGLPDYSRSPSSLAKEIRTWKTQRYTVLLMISSAERARRLADSLWDYEIEAVVIPEVKSIPQAGQVLICASGSLSGGFEIPSHRLAVITDREIFGRPKFARKETAAEGMRITDYLSIKPGDYVVHAQHGIGKYNGIRNLSVQGVKRDYFYIQYYGQDRLYIPTDQINLIQKYVGAEGHRPKLNKLGSGEWARTRARVKASVEELAQDLIELYAARQTVEGFGFSTDTAWQAEFEEAFPYGETPDQIEAIQQVKSDMEAAKPMDRLLVGDVGYGKTEVALRAAFKAVMDNKQVAVLVPTTVLAQQHFETFKERFHRYPVKVCDLSRLRKTKEQKETLKGIETGEADIVIGTHRLLSKDVKFKDLGLLVIDEEQRFGVTHKERLKRLKKNVDVLTLTATPIPRTLHMALAGARDMSVINTPPENRYPVQTYLVEYNRELVIEAVRRELERGGQVYYVRNRVEDLEQLVAGLKTSLPEAVVAVGHGQMPEAELENVMVDFVHKKIDVLVCTTIIENGLDIPNVNTLVVEEADNFGLSQLYQLRGRVGRSGRIAYAYFTYNGKKLMGEAAEKRLNAIIEFTEFGSGFKLAMRDLQIRGAGNLLGAEQHGHMLAVGFDLYCRLLEDAVSELKGKPAHREKPEVDIDINLSAFIPDSYIAQNSLKFDLYQRIRELSTEEELAQLQREMEDRFGKPPEEARNLMLVANLRVIAQELDVKSIKETAGEIKILFGANSRINAGALFPLVKEYPRQLSFSSIEGLEIRLLKGSARGVPAVRLLDEVLCKIKELAA